MKIHSNTILLIAMSLVICSNSSHNKGIINMDSPKEEPQPVMEELWVSITMSMEQLCK